MVDIGTAVEEFRARNGTRRIGRLVVDGRAVWIKQAGAPKLNRWNRVHRAASRLLGPMFRNTATAGTDQALREEGERLRRFRSMGLAVPVVLHAMDGALVLSDCGEPLAGALRRAAGPAERHELLGKAATVLRELHRRGLCHGRPFIKDMTLRDGVVHVLDLEENPTLRMSLAKAQARDVWLFLQSAARYTGDDGSALGRVLAAYRHDGDGDICRELARFVQMLKPVRAIAQRLPRRVIGSDLRRAVQANRALEAALLGAGRS